MPESGVYNAKYGILNTKYFDATIWHFECQIVAFKMP